MFDFLQNRRRKAIIEVLQRQTDHVPARETYPIDYEAARAAALYLHKTIHQSQSCANEIK